MRIIWQGIYSTLLLPALVAGARMAARKNTKLAQTLEGQEGWRARLVEKLQQRQRDKKLIWFHVASAGEYLQAGPVMERLMLRGFQCVLTVTSVSGYRWASKAHSHENLIAIEYLPLDTRANMRDMLDIIAPDALVYVKFDLWPNLIWEAQKHDVPQFLISGTLHEKSKRVTSRAARSLYKTLYKALSGIYTVSDADTQRFLLTCPKHPNVHTVGDTRFDSVLDRREAIKPPDLDESVKQQPVVLFGSSWPGDEAEVFPVLRKALDSFSDLLVIVAPHEVDEAHLEAIENAFADYNVARYSELNANASGAGFRVLLVDTVGHLSSLYHYADIAFVGGAFGKGVHNVMEPSAMGVPAIFGPFYQNSPEAMDMVEQHKAFSIKDRSELEPLIFDLLQRPEYRREAGREAARYIENKAGASDACFKLIEEALQ